MSKLDDQQKSASLPKGWTAMYKGKHPTEFGSYFVIEWDYPLTLTLACGRNVTFKSYAAHSHFVKTAVEYFKKQEKKHASVL